MSSVFLSNVDDYLAPSQACINPLFSEDANKNHSENNTDNGDKPSNPSPSTAVVTTTTRRRRVGGRRRGLGRGRDGTSQQLTNNIGSTNTNATITSRNNDSSMDITMAPPPNQMDTFHDTNNNSMVPGQHQLSLSTTPTITTTTTTTTVSTVPPPTQNKVEFSMADCLACSGCVTTAETVLVEQHSLSTLQSKCKEALDANTKICFTISPSSWSDLWRHLQIPTLSNSLYSLWARRLTTFLYQTCHASLVVDGNLPLQWSLLEAAYEFCYTYKQQQQQQQGQTILQSQNNNHNGNDAMDIEDGSHEKMEHTTTTTILEQQQPSVALSCRQSQVYTGNGETQIIIHPPGRRQLPKATETLPLIASSCPALVCLIEKSTPPAVPHLSSVKSPMAMMGTVLKKYDASSSPHHQIEQEPPTNTDSGINTSRTKNILHVAIMPCHDKKLEASRKDLQYYDNIPDTDLVITTQELLTLIAETIMTNNNNNNNNNHHSGNKTPIIGACGSVSVQDMQTYLQSLPLSSIESSLQDALLLNHNHSNNDGNNENTYNSQDHGAILVTQLWNCTNDSDDTMVDANGNNPPTPTAIMVDNHNATMMMDEDATGESSTLTTATTPNNNTPPTIPLSSWLSGSGGYADFIFKFAAQHLFGYHVSGHVPWKPVLSGSQRRRRQVKSARLVAAQQKQKSDMHEAILYRRTNGTYTCSKEEDDNSDSIPVLHFATAYGLQNIQRIIQPFKSQSSSSSMSLHANVGPQQQVVDSTSSSPYHYIEAMACPSGCINGGGQIVMPPTSSNGIGGDGVLQHAITGNTRETPTQTRQRLLETQTIFHAIHNNNNRNTKDCSGNGDVGGSGISTLAYDTVYSDSTCPSGPFGAESQKLLHTRFHIVPAMQSSNTGVPTVRDTQW